MAGDWAWLLSVNALPVWQYIANQRTCQVVRDIVFGKTHQSPGNLAALGYASLPSDHHEEHEAHEACFLGWKTCAGANAQVFGGSVGQGRIISRLRIGLFIFGAGGQKGGFLALGRLWIFGAQKIGIAVQSLGAGGGGNLASSISYGSGASAQRRGKIVWRLTGDMRA
jgi:hypothetical protein